MYIKSIFIYEITKMPTVPANINVMIKPRVGMDIKKLAFSNTSGRNSFQIIFLEGNIAVGYDGVTDTRVVFLQ